MPCIPMLDYMAIRGTVMSSTTFPSVIRTTYYISRSVHLGSEAKDPLMQHLRELLAPNGLGKW